jgi:hypothetical protein
MNTPKRECTRSRQVFVFPNIWLLKGTITMFEGCVTVIYVALIFGISVLGLLEAYHFMSLCSVMMFISLCCSSAHRLI